MFSAHIYNLLQKNCNIPNLECNTTFKFTPLPTNSWFICISILNVPRYINKKIVKKCRLFIVRLLCRHTYKYFYAYLLFIDKTHLQVLCNSLSCRASLVSRQILYAPCNAKLPVKIPRSIPITKSVQTAY